MKMQQLVGTSKTMKKNKTEKQREEETLKLLGEKRKEQRNGKKTLSLPKFSQFHIMY